MNEKEEYLKSRAEKMKDWPAEKRERVLVIIEKDWQNRKEGEKIREQHLDEICSKMIKKEELVDGGLYIAESDLCRGMWFGVWDAKEQVFQCLRYKFGYRQDDLPYFGDVRETNMAGFAPMKKIECEY
jgi:hypothetical protein